MATIPLKQIRVPLASERGQAMIVAVLALGIFLLGAIAFGVDIANLWFHRQAAQTAADSACTAGAMDLLVDATGGLTNQGNFTAGTAFDCSGSFKTSPAPCQYAALNGYDSTNSSPGNDVSVSFPGSASVPGVTAPPAGIAPDPFIRVDVIDHVQMFFSGLLSGSTTQDVRAFAVCGLVLAKSPIPIIVLRLQDPGTLTVQGTPTISIIGGPSRSIQVNSSDPAAVSMGGTGGINLECGGNAFTGSDLGVFGGPNTVTYASGDCPGTPIPPGFPTSKGGGFTPGATGAWQNSSPIDDPFAQIPAPPQPANGTATTVVYKTDGCPDTNGCIEYTAGYYAGGITVQNATAIFDPGVYYLNGGLGLQSRSMVRPAIGAPDPQGIGGTMFYLTGTAQKCSGQTGLVCVGANSGSRVIDPFATSGVQCPGGPAPDPNLGLPATVTGNVLLAPCTGTYGDPLGQYRGILFFQDRSSATGGGWGGGGGFLLAGSMYFHQCNGSGTGLNCSSADFNSNFNLQGNSGNTSYILGEIITDTLTMGGTPTINMALNPNATYSILKASLLR